MKGFWVSVVAGVISVVVGLKEWFYLHEDAHHGAAGELVALALAGALVAFAVAGHLYADAARERERQLRAFQDAQRSAPSQSED